MNLTYDANREIIIYTCITCRNISEYYVEYVTPTLPVIIGSKAIHWVPNPAICTCGHSILWHPQNYGCCLPTQFQECNCYQFTPMPDSSLSHEMGYICKNCYSLAPSISQLNDFLLSLRHKSSS